MAVGGSAGGAQNSMAVRPATTDVGPAFPRGPQPPNMFNVASDAVRMGASGAIGEMGYQPMLVDPTQFMPAGGFGGSSATGPSGGSTIRISGGGGGNVAGINEQGLSVNAPVVGAEQLANFYNPYESQVIDASLSDIDRARMMQANQAAAQAQAAGAFGGSRAALMEAEIGRNALEQAAQTSAQLRAQGFNTAAGNALNLAGMGLQAEQATAGNLLGARQSTLQGQVSRANAQTAASAQLASSKIAQQTALQNAQMQAALNAQLANQGALLQGSQQRLGAGLQLANIGNLGFGQAQNAQQAMAQSGLQQQALNQAIMDAAAQQYQGYQSAPAQSLAMVQSALGAAPIPQTTSTSQSLGLMDVLTGGAGIAGALGFSDINLKTNIQRIGTSPMGVGIYTWDWNDKAKTMGVDDMTTGVIAQELQAVRPDLVSRHESGYLQVNYGGLYAS